MKKILIMLLGVLFASQAMAQSFTYTYEGQTLDYEVIDEEGKCVQVSDKSRSVTGDLVIPSVVCDGEVEYTVVAIGEEAFYECYDLTSILIPNTVSEIKDFAFFDCRGLISMMIPSSVSEIGMSAFSRCSGLTEINVEAGNLYFSSVDGVVFSSDVASLLIYPGGRIGEYSIPGYVTEIGPLAFAYSEGLTAIGIPDSVTEIGMGAFALCEGLTSVTLPASIAKIEDYVFSGCFGLVSVVIPDSVTEIGMLAFEGCISLEAVILPDYVTAIGMGAFGECHCLTTVTIPASVEEIGLEAFSSCWDLAEIVVEEGNKHYCSIDGVVFNLKATKLLIYPCGKHGEYLIPDGVTEIGESAFGWIVGLTSVVIPESVKEIGEYAFYSCESLTSITIPPSVTKIGKAAFGWCYSLEAMTLPNSVIKISEETFYACGGMISVTIPESVKEIGSQAFEWCDNLREIQCHAKLPPTVSEDSFGEYSYQDVLLEVPEESVEAYRSDSVWGRFMTIAPSGVNTVVADELTPISVYDLSGQCRYGNVKPEVANSLTPGVYVIRQGGLSKKIVVK